MDMIWTLLDALAALPLGVLLLGILPLAVPAVAAAGPSIAEVVIPSALGFLGGLFRGQSEQGMSREQIKSREDLAREQEMLQLLLSSLGLQQEFLSQDQLALFNEVAQNQDLFEFLQTQQGVNQRAAADRVNLGEIPATMSSLALKRALFEGIPAGATNANLITLGAPAGLDPSFIPQIQGGISLDPAKAAAQQYLSDDVLAADLQRFLGAEARLDPGSMGFDVSTLFPSQGDAANQALDALRQQTQASMDEQKAALEAKQAGLRTSYASSAEAQRQAILDALEEATAGARSRRYGYDTSTRTRPAGTAPIGTAQQRV